MLACREHKGDPPRGDPPCAQNCAFDSFYVLKATQSKCLIYPNCSQISVGFTNFTTIPKRTRTARALDPVEFLGEGLAPLAKEKNNSKKIHPNDDYQFTN